MDRNDNRFWYDKGYSLGVTETQRDAVIPRLIGAWVLFIGTWWEPVVIVPCIALYTVWSLMNRRDRVAEAEHKRECHDPGREWE